MKSTIMIAALLWASPAVACHHYSRWYFPTPQHCGGSYVWHQRRIPIHRSGGNPVSAVPIRVIHDVPHDDIPLPILNDDLAWDMPLETKEQLELYDEIQRRKAILLLPHGE
jgi:hypothetical protein